MAGSSEQVPEVGGKFRSRRRNGNMWAEFGPEVDENQPNAAQSAGKVSKSVRLDYRLEIVMEIAS